MTGKAISLSHLFIRQSFESPNVKVGHYEGKLKGVIACCA